VEHYKLGAAEEFKYFCHFFSKIKRKQIGALPLAFGPTCLFTYLTKEVNSAFRIRHICGYFNKCSGFLWLFSTIGLGGNFKKMLRKNNGFPDICFA